MPQIKMHKKSSAEDHSKHVIIYEHVDHRLQSPYTRILFSVIKRRNFHKIKIINEIPQETCLKHRKHCRSKKSFGHVKRYKCCNKSQINFLVLTQSLNMFVLIVKNNLKPNDVP